MRSLWLCLALTSAGCVAKLPQEPPVRVLELARNIEVVLVSSEPGRLVRSVDDDGLPAEVLGHTPVVIDRLTIDKEIWKHGAMAPPPVEAVALVERRTHGRGEVRRAAGASLHWTVAVGDPPEILTFSIKPSALDRAFSDGRLEFSIDDPAPSAGSHR